jgi:hypothetical protein
MGNKEKMMMAYDRGLVDASPRVYCGKDVWERSVFARDREDAIILASIFWGSYGHSIGRLFVAIAMP